MKLYAPARVTRSSGRAKARNCGPWGERLNKVAEVIRMLVSTGNLDVVNAPPLATS